MFNSDGQQVNLSSEDNLNLNELPEHVDNLFLNRNVHKGILGFRYETKDTEIIVYTSIEVKTFCMIMQLKPIARYVLHFVSVSVCSKFPQYLIFPCRGM